MAVITKHCLSRKGKNSPNWKGGRRINAQGYAIVRLPSHPRASGNGYVLEHILVAEKALGKPLPPGAVVHHGAKERANNKKSGHLVVCQDADYHKLLHARMRAYHATGDPHKRQCWICKKHDDPINLITDNHKGYMHEGCQREYQRGYRQHYKRGGYNCEEKK